MPLHGARLFSSSLYAESTDAEFRSALRLWWAAWTQCPAGSLPTSDNALAVLADFGRDVKGWLKVKKRALHGFVLCSDGRLYHPFLCSEALVAFEARLKSDTKRKGDRERLQRWREAQKVKPTNDGGNGGGNGSCAPAETAIETVKETPCETMNETRFVAGRQDKTVQETPSLRSSPLAAPASPSSADKRGTRLPDDWTPSTGDYRFAENLGLDATRVAEEFRAYWLALPGQKARKLDWSMTFQNRCREVADRQKSKPAARFRPGPAGALDVFDLADDEPQFQPNQPQGGLLQ